MPMPRTEGMLLTAVAVCCAAAVLTGCSDDSTPSSVSSAASKAASAAASAAESLGREATGAASSILASATAEAGRRLDDIQDGTDVKSDTKLGKPAKDSDGRTAVKVTVSNTTDSTRSFAVQTDFRDAGGNLLDTSVTTVSDVPAGKTGTATARSNRDLSGEVRTEVARAVRY